MAAKQFGRWKYSTSLFGARDDAFLTSLTDGARFRTSDAAAVRRRGDQKPEPGQLLCRLAQHGETGDWRAVDGNGRPLTVTTGADGVLEIRHGPGNDDQEDPDQIQLQSPFGDASAGGPGELEAGKGVRAAHGRGNRPVRSDE
jgi:hypothetical protein